MTAEHAEGGLVVLDRTGQLLAALPDALLRLGYEDLIRDGGRLSAYPLEAARADVMLVGPKELNRTALARLTRLHDRHPFTVIAAVLPEAGAPDKAALRAAGVTVTARGVVTVAKVARLMDRAYAELDRYAEDAAELAGPAEEAEPEVIKVIEVLDSLDDLEVEPQPDPEPEPEPEAVAAIPGPRLAEPPEQLQPEQPEQLPPVAAAQVVTVASATGGCGKTFIATNIAALLARSNRRCLLVDLDLQFGEVAAALHVHHPYSVYDGLFDQKGEHLPEESLEEHLAELVVPHELGFDVLTAPRDPALADYVGARDAAHVLDVVSRHYDVVVVDTPPSLNEVVLTTLERSDLVAVMATLDVPSLKNLTVFVDTLRRLQIDDSRVHLILNKIDSDVGISVHQAQSAFHGRFEGFLPLAREVSRSVNAGTAVVRSEPRSKVSRALVSTVAALLPDQVQAAPAESRPNWWQWLRRGRASAAELPVPAIPAPRRGTEEPASDRVSSHLMNAERSSREALRAARAER